MKIQAFILSSVLATVLSISVSAQKSDRYNLAELVKTNQIDTAVGSGLAIPTGSRAGVISAINSVWFKNIQFKEGTIDIDLKGKNAFLQSFLGIIFHGVDTAHFDVLYFRPFNFHHQDTSRRHWSVQYMAIPEHDYDRLRKEHPLVYENAVNPVPDPDDWFHAKIQVKGGVITVWVENSSIASLQVPLLADNQGTALGLFSDGLRSDFCGLVITPSD